MEMGNLVVGRITGMEGKYIAFLFNAQQGRILEMSKDFTENETRTFLAKNYGLSDADIEQLLVRANTRPAI